jgi:hypothetical protein
MPCPAQDGRRRDRPCAGAQQEDAKEEQPNAEDGAKHSSDYRAYQRDGVVTRSQGGYQRPGSRRASHKPHYPEEELHNPIAPKAGEHTHYDRYGSSELASPSVIIHRVTFLQASKPGAIY